MKITLYNLLLLVAVCFCQSVAGQNIITYAGTHTGFLGDGGVALAAQMDLPVNSAKDAAGNLYIADANNNRIRMVTPSGIIQTMAGTGAAGFGGDGGPASAAQLQHPSDVKTDAAGNIFVCDAYNSCVRKINSAGTISTIAGSPGIAGFSGDEGSATAATLDTPAAIALDAAGNLYIADRGNNRIRKVSTSGIISTIAGAGGTGLSGLFGPATAANTGAPTGVAVDASGNVFVALADQHQVLKINLAGSLLSFAGTGTAGFSGDAAAATSATLHKPQNICTDALGNVYIADMGNQRVRKVNTLGNIYTIAGSGFVGCCTDGSPATTALMNNPMGVTVDDAGQIFIADADNARIRRVDARANTIPEFVYGPRFSYLTCEGAVMNLSGTMSTYLALAGETLTWTEVGASLHGSISGLPTTVTSTSLMMLPSASVLYTPSIGYSGIDSFMLEVSDGTASDTITVVVSLAPNPDPGSISGPAEVCEHESITLSNAASGGGWYSPMSSIATVSSAGVVTGVGAGVAVISYLVTNSCATLAATYNVTVRPAADCAADVPSLNTIGEVLVAPNPADDVFTITLPQSVLLPARVTLTDLPGREAANWNMMSSRVLQVSVDAPPGMYFLSVWSNGKREVVPLTIQ